MLTAALLLEISEDLKKKYLPEHIYHYERGEGEKMGDMENDLF